jgi:hypothetical protein
MKPSTSLFLSLFLLFLSVQSTPLAKLVPVGASLKGGISLVDTDTATSTHPEVAGVATASKGKTGAGEVTTIATEARVTAKSTAQAHTTAQATAQATEQATEQTTAQATAHTSAQTTAETTAKTSETAMLAEETAIAAKTGWAFDLDAAADDESDRGVRRASQGSSRRRRMRAWMAIRFRTRCPRGQAGAACREVRRARWRLYRAARKAFLKKHWGKFGKSVKRACRGPWTTRCPVGDDGTVCRNQRRKWRRKCRAAAFTRRRRSCRGPWIKRCPAGGAAAAVACRATRRSYRRRCRARRALRKARGRLSGTRSRIARFAARLLASRSSYLIRNRRVKLIYIGRNRVLEWRPKTGFFQIFRVRRKSLDRVSSRPLWRKRERVVWGRWAKLTRPWRLVYVGRRRLLAHNKRNGKYRIFKIRRSVTGNANPLVLKARGRWRRAKGRSLLYLGGRRLATFRRKNGRYAVWKVNNRKTGKNKRVFVRVTRKSSWILARRRAKYTYVGKNTVLQWHKNKYRLINFNRRAKGKQAAFRYIKGGAMNIAMNRQWPYRSGTPNVRVVYLGGRLLLFYRVKGSRKVSASGKKLRRLTLYPFKVTVLNNPRFNPAGAVKPWLVSKPWLAGRAWQTSKAYKPWLTDPRYCLTYKTWAPAGRAFFTTRNRIGRLGRATGARDNRILRVGRLLIDWSPSTGSYRMLKYSRSAKMFTQRSFGVFPGFRARWQLVALGKRRLLNYNPATRRFVLYPISGYNIRRPIASGTLPVPRGFKFIPMGSKMLLAWNPLNGQWRAYKVNADVTGVKTSPLRRMVAGGQWCDIKAGTTVLALGKRNILTVDKRSGEYSLYRFNKWAKGRRGNVFKRVLARGTWTDPFLNSRTRLVALRGGRIMGWQPRKGRGALYTTWTMGYTAGVSGRLGTVQQELAKLVATLKGVRRSLMLKGRNVDPTMALLQQPNFAGMKYKDLKRMFAAYLSDVKVKFPWKNTLEYFRNQQARRARGLTAGRPELSNGARGPLLRAPGAGNGIYGMGSVASEATGVTETQPAPTTGRSSGAPSGFSIGSGSSAPVREAPAPTQSLQSMGGNDVWPDGGKMQEDMFDDGTGPVRGSRAPRPINPLTRSDSDVLVQFPNFPQVAPIRE